MTFGRLVCLSLSLLCIACGDVHQPLQGIDSGPPPDGPPSVGTDFGTLDGPVLINDLSTDPGGPVIVVTQPLAGTEVAYDTLTVLATVTSPTMTLIDNNSVVLTIATGATTTQSQKMAPNGMPNVYSAAMDISAIPSGNTEFDITAQDINGKKGSIKVAYVHDHGPSIIFTQPSAPTAKGKVGVQMVISDPLHKVDPATVMAGIRSANDIVLTPVGGTAPAQTVIVNGVIDFNSSIYMPAPDGPQLIRAQAANDKGTIARATKQFTVDNAGPVIQLVKPVAGQFVGGVLNIQVTITDLSDVNDSTVLAVFGGSLTNAVKLTRVMAGQPDFQGLFDVRTLGRNYVLPTLSVRADDTLGNHSEVAEEIVVDNTPPMLSLDPPLMRVSQFNAQLKRECSELFDPVGSESASDHDRVRQIITLKARVEDHGNFASGLAVERYSGLVAASVEMWLIPATMGGTEVLSTDTDGDGICDDVNPVLMPTSNVTMSNEAVTINLVPLGPGGTPDFTLGTGSGAVPPGWAPVGPPNPREGCEIIGDPSVLTPPLPLCTHAGTNMTYVLPHNDPASGGVAIWTIAPVANTPYDCVGFQFDSLNRLPEGPACIAVRATDVAGNHNVSPPMRVCIERATTGICNAFLAAPLSALPNCTGTYTKATGMTTSAPCTPEIMFAPNEVERID